MGIAVRDEHAIQEPEVGLAAFLRPAMGPVGASARDETITSLAGQWREAQAIAEAQEERLAALEAAAAKLCGVAAPASWRESDELEFAEPMAPPQDAAAVRQSLGLPAQEEAANCAGRLAERLTDRLLALPPTNVREAAIKYGVLLTVVRGEVGELESGDLLSGFLDDLVRLAEPPAQ